MRAVAAVAVVLAGSWFGIRGAGAQPADAGRTVLPGASGAGGTGGSVKVGPAGTGGAPAAPASAARAADAGTGAAVRSPAGAGGGSGAGATPAAASAAGGAGGPSAAVTPDAGAAPESAAVAKPRASVREVMKEVVKDVVKEAGRTLVGGAAPLPPDPAKVADPAARLALLRRKILKEEDFFENDETNRDPFRNYLGIFTARGAGARTPKVPAIFEKFAMEELRLIAIISGDANPRAMFRDPGGLGQTLKRGDYISKAGSRIAKILSDRVVLEMNEIGPNGDIRTVERAILMNPEVAQK